MKYIVKTLFLSAILLFFCQNQAIATHIIGGEITYKCLGNQNYELTLVVFRDCYNGNPAAYFDDPASIGVFDKGWNLKKELKIAWNSSINDTIPPQLSNPCLALPPDVCVHTTIYKSTVILPFLADGYKLVYQRCCRNTLIQNIVNPLGTGASFITEITAAGLTACNNSPTFKNWPPIAICVNEPIDFDHSATDLDGDSIVYSLCQPVNGADPIVPRPQPPVPSTIFPVVWVPPFGVNNFLNSINSTDSMKIDSKTGFITGIPDIIGNFVVAICIEEYRNGVLLTRIQRDFQYNVADCGKAVSAFFAPEVLCDTKTIYFSNQSSAKAKEFIWYFDWPNINGPKSTDFAPTYTFPDTGYYTIALFAEPNGICRDTSYKTIHVTNSHISANFDYEITDCNGPATIKVVDLTVDSLFSVVNWAWTLNNGIQSFDNSDKTPTFFVPPSSGIWTLTLVATSANGCADTLVETFNSPYPNILNTGNAVYNVCKNQPVSINPNGNIAYSYTWTPPTYLNDALADNPTSTPEMTTIYMVSVSDGFCSTTTQVTVNVLSPVAFFTAPETICNDSSVYFLNGSQSATNYKWYFNWPNINFTSNSKNPTFTFPDTGYYTIALIANPLLPCRDTFFRVIHLINTTAAANFSIETTDCVNSVATIKLTDLSTISGEIIVGWNWLISNGTNNFTSNLQNPTLEIPLDTAEIWTIQLEILTQNGCSAIFLQDFKPPFPNLNLINDEFVVCRGQSVPLNPQAVPNWTYSWTPPTFLDNPASQNAVSTPTSDIVYSVLVSNGQCSATKQVSVYVNPTSILNVKASPDTILIGETSLLTVTSFANLTNFSWLPDVTLSNLTIKNPIAKPTETTTYFVETVDLNGCPVRGEVIVVVRNPKCVFPEIFFPTAFSPNGDSENDVLQIQGADIQEVSWIIYNRWGQEIFKADSIDDVWDGTFFGEKLPPDAYAYYLRLRCFGGRETTQQGNVTLIR
jgi:gliding motility-associated-like protein